MTWYALATYRVADGTKPALVLADEFFDLAEIYSATRTNERLPKWIDDGLLGALLNWDTAETQLTELAAIAAELKSAGEITTIEGGQSRILAPITPPQIFACASNYREHAKEMGTVLAEKAESHPYMFIKASTAVIGPGQTVLIPPETEKLDWEVELGAVIGRSVRRVSVEDALDCVAGYTIINDVSARDLTRRSDFPFKFDWFQGKSFDTFAPLGPWIVPSSVIGDPHALKLRLSVNDELMQDGTTAELIFNVAEQISYLSDLLTLQPGDVIATGTPTGVGASRGIFLKPGDVMRAIVENIGELENPVEAEPV